MLTDQDIQKLKEVLATKEDAKEIRTDLKEVKTDLANLELKFDTIPTKDDLVKILESTYDLAKLKVEHDHMKKIMREEHHVEI